MDRQALVEVEQLDEHLSARAVASHMLLAQPGCRVLVYCLDEQPAIRQPTEPLGRLAKPSRGRPDPFLRTLGAAGSASQRADAVTAAVEVVELVDRQQDRDHRTGHHEHPHFASREANRSSVSRAASSDGTSFASTANTKTRPSTSLTVPANATTVLSVPVFART